MGRHFIHKLFGIIKKPYRYAKRKSIQLRHSKIDVNQIFSDIYSRKYWGFSGESPFYSGSGSHDSKVVAPYVQACREFFESLSSKPSIADLGCGDFSVGQQLVPYAKQYTGYDVVSELITHNTIRFSSKNVKFKLLDLTKDTPDKSNVALIRQVFQHLSNAHIQKCLSNIEGRFDYLILTEQLPINIDFPLNIDKQTSHDTRLIVGSGLDITMPPFRFKFKEFRIISEVPVNDGRIVTFLFKLQ